MLLISLLALAAVQSAEAPPVMTVTVEKLPPAYRRPSVVRIEFGADGHVARCKVEKGSGSAMIDRVACRQASAVVLTGDDQAKAAPRTITVTFARDSSKG